MEEAPVHAAAVEQPHGPGVAVGQDSLGAIFPRDCLQPLRNRIKRFVPGDALEFSFALAAGALLREEKALGMIFAFEVLRYFSAEEAACDGMSRVSAQAGGVVV